MVKVVVMNQENVMLDGLKWPKIKKCGPIC